jgi:hypothetical protein
MTRLLALGWISASSAPRLSASATATATATATIVAERQIWGGQFVAAEDKACSGRASLLRSDERVEHDLPDLLSAAAGDGELGCPLQCLFA